MTSSEMDVGNAYVQNAGYSNTNPGQNTSESTERTLRMKCTSEQGRYLAYLTIKHMVRTQGPHFQKGVSLGMNTWISITRELNALGIEKTPEQWRKCYSAAKYFAHMRFMRMMREKQAASGNLNIRPDWNEIEIRDLLYLQDWRCKGFPDMPEPDILMHAFENKQMYLTDYLPPSPKSNFAYARDNFYDNNSFGGNFSDFSQFPMPQQHQLQREEVDIKCELDGSAETDATAAFHQQLQQMVDAQSRMEYATPRTKVNTPPTSMPKPVPLPPHAEADSHASCTSTRNSVHASRCREYTSESEHAAPSSSDAGAAPDHHYFERRVLEISEKLLKEKSKQVKALRKRNKILKQTRKEQKKQTEVLNKLLEQLVARR